MPSSQGLSRGGHGHWQRGEENKNGSGGETALHTTTMVPYCRVGIEWAEKRTTGQQRVEVKKMPGVRMSQMSINDGKCRKIARREIDDTVKP